MSLRSVLTRATAVLAAFATIATVALIVLTTHLRDAAGTLRASVGSLRVVGAIEVGLLIHARTTDDRAGARIASELERRLAEGEAFVGSPAEAELLRDVQRNVGAYLRRADDARSADDFTVAFAATKRLVDMNMRQADDAVAQAGRLDAFANALGLVLAIALSGGAVVVIRWLRRALRPVVDVGAAMRRFGGGDRSARAPERGASEVREIARQFNDMADALARQEQNQRTFLAGVAHDIRTPLQALTLSAAQIAPGAPLPAEERVRQILGVVSRQARRLERLAGDFLDASSIEAGQLSLRFERCDARDLATAAAALFAGTSAHELRVDTPAAPIPLDCDPTRIEQVLNNLVSNAVKYSPAGSVIEIDVRRDDGHVIFGVRDRGVGLTPEDRERLFEPFRRVGAGSRAAPGVGLGLSISRRIVEAHGGGVSVDSTPGNGSYFQVRLPSAPADTHAGQNAEP